MYLVSSRWLRSFRFQLSGAHPRIVAYTAVCAPTELPAWLTEQGAGSENVIARFEEELFRTVAEVVDAELSEEDLEELGVADGAVRRSMLAWLAAAVGNNDATVPGRATKDSEDCGNDNHDDGGGWAMNPPSHSGNETAEYYCDIDYAGTMKPGEFFRKFYGRGRPVLFDLDREWLATARRNLFRKEILLGSIHGEREVIVQRVPYEHRREKRPPTTMTLRSFAAQAFVETTTSSLSPPPLYVFDNRPEITGPLLASIGPINGGASAGELPWPDRTNFSHILGEQFSGR